VDYEKWREKGNRSQEYYSMLLKKLGKIYKLTDKDLMTNAFVKDEGYPIKNANGTLEYKHCRTINAYTDETKALYGPLFAIIEKLFFNQDLNLCASHFVKQVPVKDRPALLEETFGTNPVCVGDFSSFESHMRGFYAKIIAHCITYIAGDFFDADLKKMFSMHMLETNISLFKGSGVKTQIDQTLMSGAVWTSLANCMLSHFLVSYLRLRVKFPTFTPKQLARSYAGNFVGFCEGDDSITLGGAYNSELIKMLGLTLKSEYLDKHGAPLTCNLSSFCGIVKPFGVDAIVTDPKKVICRFFQLSREYGEARKSKQDCLIRAKALSYYYQYKDCPIIGHLCYATLKLTRSATPDPSQLSYNLRNVYDQLPKDKFYRQFPNIDPQTRDLVADLFDFSVSEQLDIEDKLMRWGNGEEVIVNLPDHLFDDYVEHSGKYVEPVPTRDYPAWLRRKDMPNPEIMVGVGVFNVQKFLTLKPTSTTQALECTRYKLGKKIRCYKFDYKPDVDMPWRSNYTFNSEM